jgi:ribonucleoside-diphosphate reductase beta chain
VYEWAVDIAKQHEDLHWTEKDVKLQDDVEQWQRGDLSEDEKYLIKQILRLFTQSDVNVGQNYYDVFIPTFRNNEIRNMLGSFAAREAIHQRGYALLNDTLGFGEDFYNEFLEYEEMAAKNEFMLNLNKASQRDIAVSLAKQVFSEGVALFSSFAMLINFDQYGKMKGMSDLVRWSIKDESVHIEGNARLFRTFLEEHPRIVNDGLKGEIYQAARDLIELEDLFIDKAFAISTIANLDKEAVKQYVRYVADYRLEQLGLKKNWQIGSNPLPFMDWLLKSAHANFFEREVVDYSKNNMVGDYAGGY